MLTIRLSPSAVRKLAKPVRGRGGHQTLLRRLQTQVKDGVLTVTDADHEKILRYALDYGGGGFQERLAGPTGRRAAKGRARGR